MQQTKGIFTISLDCELYWGIFENVQLQSRLDYFSNTRATIPKVLALFDRYNVHVTWATVGMLFAENWDDWEVLNPVRRPNYSNTAVDPYRLKALYGHKREWEYCFFAPDLIKKILSVENQELGTHTYSHYFCQEPGQDVTAFEADLKAAKQAAARFDVNLKSLVFPRNQIREDYLKVCFDQGIINVRSNPADWFWQETGKETLTKKVFRTGDAFVPLGKAKSYTIESLALKKDKVLQLPASRFLRPHSDKFFLNRLRLRRILNEMEEAAKSEKCYHLWWHPHNFGHFPTESLVTLEIILKKYKSLQDRYGMQSLTMNEYNNLLEDR